LRRRFFPHDFRRCVAMPFLPPKMVRLHLPQRPMLARAEARVKRCPPLRLRREDFLRFVVVRFLRFVVVRFRRFTVERFFLRLAIGVDPLLGGL
jgi:hypothetical protein